MATETEYNVHLQSSRELFIRIDLLNQNNIKIDEIQGVSIDGSISIDAESAVRRTCSLTIAIINSSFLISESSKIWLDKRFRVFLGIKNILTNDIVWFDKGIFIMDSPSVSYSSAEKTLSLSGKDLMCLLDGTIDGELTSLTNIPAGINITTAMRSTIQTLGGINQISLDNNSEVTPYDIEKNAGDTVYDIISELKNLFMDWQIYFNESGVFIYEKIKNRQFDPVIWSFSDINRNLIISYDINSDFANVRNRIIVNGSILDDGTVIRTILDNTDENSPFNINKPFGIREKVFNEDKLFTQEQAIAKATYELWKRNNLAEKVDINCIPIYLLDVNRLVEFNNPDINLVGKYCINKITIPFKIDSTMSFSCYKIY